MRAVSKGHEAKPLDDKWLGIGDDLGCADGVKIEKFRTPDHCVSGAVGF